MVRLNTDMKQHLLQYFEKGIRFDGRKLDQYRDVSVETNISKSAEGSCRIKIGETEVLIGVKFELGTPYPDSPDQGSLMVGAELLPMASPEFEPGPPSIDSIELARVIDRGIRESGFVEFKKLCITEGEKIWTVILDIIAVNDAGNLFDAAGLGVVVALKNARIPKIENDKVNYKELTDEKVPLTKQDPVSITIWKVGDYIIADPSNEEQAMADARLTVAVNTAGDICAMQKGGEQFLTSEEVDTMVELAVAKSKELRKHIEG